MLVDGATMENYAYNFGSEPLCFCMHIQHFLLQLLFHFHIFSSSILGSEGFDRVSVSMIQVDRNPTGNLMALTNSNGIRKQDRVDEISTWHPTITARVRRQWHHCAHSDEEGMDRNKIKWNGVKRATRKILPKFSMTLISGP